MKNLFYSEKQKLAFWVSGYDISTNRSCEIIDYLKRHTLKASKIFNCEFEDVETYVINESRRYKYMRVFFATMDKCPENAFDIGENRIMVKWLND